MMVVGDGCGAYEDYGWIQMATDGYGRLQKYPHVEVFDPSFSVGIFSMLPY